MSRNAAYLVEGALADDEGALLGLELLVELDAKVGEEEAVEALAMAHVGQRRRLRVAGLAQHVVAQPAARQAVRGALAQQHVRRRDLPVAHDKEKQLHDDPYV